MTGEWTKMPLREAGVALIDCDHRTPPAAKTGYPYIAIPQIKEGRIDISDARRISREHFIEWTRKAKPQNNDVILSRRCNPGETAHVPAGLDCALGQNLVLLRSQGTKVFPPLLRWLVRSPAWWEQIGKFINVGAVFDSLKCADIPHFELPIPPLPDQKAIAHILGALDDKIELNRRINQTLEAIAQALFKSWFLDPPKHTRPNSWVYASLAELMDIQGGTQPPAYEFLSEPHAGYVRLIQIRDYQSDAHLTFIPDTPKLRKCSREDVMIARYGASVARICWGLEGAYNVALVKAAPRKPYYREYLRSYLQSRDFQTRLLGMSNRSAQAGFNKGDIASFELEIPPCATFERYQTAAWSLRSLHNNAESRTLTQLRDTLLPKLLSGELRVPAAGKALEKST